MAALPIVRHYVRLRRGLLVLFTTTTLSSSEVIMNLLPDGVIYQVQSKKEGMKNDNGSGRVGGDDGAAGGRGRVQPLHSWFSIFHLPTFDPSVLEFRPVWIQGAKF
ncbi:hypothetical protein ZEAMMB73_Zm00001d028336 [Zea mays]|uniref:Uncharacterized protein n=1 Tax=Zea mays TaxID=4577 RepID=A0A1D6JV62_MAIZE|nr:hypothetical protein ZEAMMB73_Zm00001d028336 [Zea mays]